MNTNLKQSDSVEVLSSTLSKPTSTILQLSHPTNVTRTINNTNSNNNNNNQTTTKSVRRFSCAVCNIDLSNQKHFNSHLNSRQHQQAQSIHDVLQSVAPEYRPAYKAMFSPEMLNKKVFNRQLRCEKEINQMKKPLLGLNYIIEFQFENFTDPPQYICELCHLKFSSESLLSHILNIQHQQKFLKNNHQDMYERVMSASNIRSEQQRLIENYAKQIQLRHGGPGNIQLYIQLDSFIGQKPIVLAVTFKSQSGPNSKGHKKASIQLMAKTFQEYNYSYENIPIKDEKELTSEQTVNNEDSIQRGLSPEDLLYPFERQFWYQNYKDLLGSRPIDPHSVTYEETIPEPNNLQPFQGISQTTSNTSPLSAAANDSHVTLENGQTIRRNTSQPSNRRVILDTNRTPTLTQNGILRISPTKNKPNFDGYTLLNEQQKTTNGTNAVLNEQSARAILAASGLLQSDEEDEYNMTTSSQSSKTNEESKQNSNQIVSPLIAKRMLDAVLDGDLDVVHIQPYFSTFVNLIQTGQVELERHQAERLLHKVLVTSSTSSLSPIMKNEPVKNSNKRARSTSRSRECRSSSTSLHHQYEDYRSSTESNPKKYSSSTRNIHLKYDNKTINGNASVD
ncbi:unnamed protein product [Rotaria socialis]|uniref:C2H2-type domain-containing protein n=1 Tax=Rotaria socialis TaxID=392032 RepID=A0A817ZM65_9BILA|nr:unnamed protein product [Rotaria socialis]